MLMNLAGRKCLVVGGGKVAAGKIDGLLHHGAEVIVVAPRAVRRSRVMPGPGLSSCAGARFPRSLDGAFLAIAATSSPVTNAAVFRACTERGILCNSVDDPAHCDFFYPSVVRRGNLQIAISTGGHSPALAARLRRELEMQFGPEWSAWVDYLGEKRNALLLKNCPMENANTVCCNWPRESLSGVPQRTPADRPSKRSAPGPPNPPQPSAPLPFNKPGLHIDHRIYDQLDEPTVQYPVLLPQIVVGKHVAELPLAVAARCAHILRSAPGSRQSEKAFRICSSFLRPET